MKPIILNNVSVKFVVLKWSFLIDWYYEILVFSFHNKLEVNTQKLVSQNTIHQNFLQPEKIPAFNAFFNRIHLLLIPEINFSFIKAKTASKWNFF